MCGPRVCTDDQRGWARAVGGGSPPNTERRGSSASLGCLRLEKMAWAGKNGGLWERVCVRGWCVPQMASGLRPLARPHRQRGTSTGSRGLRGHQVVRPVPKVLLRRGLLGPIRTGNVINSQRSEDKEPGEARKTGNDPEVEVQTRGQTLFSLFSSISILACAASAKKRESGARPRSREHGPKKAAVMKDLPPMGRSLSSSFLFLEKNGRTHGGS